MTKWKTGLTTGSCSAAAAKAAALHLCGRDVPADMDIAMPDGTRQQVPATILGVKNGIHEAAVIKDAGSDPDVTHGMTIIAGVAWADSNDVVFAAGKGVGTVTRPGLLIPPGEPAINPVPRRMITEAVREVTDRPVRVTISIPGGEEIALKTFNPRLGIQGGLSILGTSGQVRPFSSTAMREALACCFSVAREANVTALVLVPGHIGNRAAGKHFRFSNEQLIEAGNEWGFAVDQAAAGRFRRILVVGHPGKLAKLAFGEWDTHSSRSKNVIPDLARFTGEVLGNTSRPESSTVEGFFESLAARERSSLGCALARKIRDAVQARLGKSIQTAIVLINMKGDILGTDGGLESWKL